MGENVNKGSRKHILKWIEEDIFINEFNSSLSKYNVKLINKDNFYPKSCDESNEVDLPTFLKTQKVIENNFEFQKWWAPESGKLPTWDLISICKMNNKDGILLVEAKAHEGEFDYSGKKIDDGASVGSLRNHINIGKKIYEACHDLSEKTKQPYNFSIFSHYQLANRLTWAWKLALLRVPVCLVYIGFIGDKYFSDMFENDDGWNKKLNNYLDGVVPKDFAGVNINGTNLIFCRISKKVN
jgi:hypothetical protein